MIRVEAIQKTFKLYRSPAVRLKEILLRKNFHAEHKALKGISFEVGDGETLGIIGPNGAGKSTMLKILTGILLADSGTIFVTGRITGLLELGTGFNPEMTGLQNIYMNGLLLGMSREEIEGKLDQVVEFTELGDFIYETLKTYSSGMVMRLAFSVAIHADPKCFVVDEALSVGDAYFQQKCMHRIKEFRRNGGSIIFVSHDMNAVKILCDKAILLHHGAILEAGSPDHVVNSYNFLVARLSDQHSKMRLANREVHSYGTFDAQIKSVAIVGSQSGSDVISSGELVTVTVELEAKEDLPEIVVGILIRDKYGQDIFGSNTYHYNLPISMKAGTTAICRFHMPLNIGPGKYTLTAALHTKDTHLEECMHWADNLVTFEVAGNQGQYFTGLCKLRPEIEIVKELV